MRLFAIGDLHLPGGQDKPMDIFGLQWQDHSCSIREAWLREIRADDWVLVPGDISWAMRLEEAAADLAYLGGLPGRVVLLRGNHDYWWQGIGKVREALPTNVWAIQNDSLSLSLLVAVCGTRGWELPWSEGATSQDIRIYEREVQRLHLSLEHAKDAGAERIVAMLHYPPTDRTGRPTGFTAALEEYGVSLCVYGHLHGEAARRLSFQGKLGGVQYVLASADAIGFQPLYLGDLDSASCACWRELSPR